MRWPCLYKYVFVNRKMHCFDDTDVKTTIQFFIFKLSDGEIVGRYLLSINYKTYQL